MSKVLRIAVVVAFVANAMVFVWRLGSHRHAVDPTTARANFITKLNGIHRKPNGKPHEPPASVYKVIRYPSKVGTLAAYLTPEPGDGIRRPAVIWAHGGYSGIWDDAWTPDDDQSPRAFLNKDFILMVPSWRRENDNDGSFELFLGEVDDLLAAVRYLRDVPYVDNNRIYVVGYSIGGTLAILAAESTNTFRAAFSIGATTDVAHWLADGEGQGPIPFDPRDPNEIAIRNPMSFVDSLQVPTFYFEGGSGWDAPDACRMELLARGLNRPFHTIIVPSAHHWSILQPACALIADKIRNDNAATCNIQIDVHEAEAVYRSMPQPQQVF